MENLAPPHELIIHLKHSMECGDSVRKSVEKYCSAYQHEYSRHISIWLKTFDQGVVKKEESLRGSNQFRSSLLFLLERGLRGEPILSFLNELEIEICDACRREVDTFLAKLPFKLLVPLLGLMFPSLVAVFLGPFIARLLSSI